MSLRSACILLGLLLLGTDVVPGSIASHRGADTVVAGASHVTADLARSNAPHEDAAGGPPRADSLVRAPRHDALPSSGKDVPQADACWVGGGLGRCPFPAGATNTLTTSGGGTGRQAVGHASSRAPPAG